MVAGLLFWALAQHPYGYFILLRWITCGVSAYYAYLSYSLKRIPWTWLFGIIAIMFNPIAPIHLERQTWVYFDVSAGIIFLVSIIFVRELVKSINHQK